jgi:hypothetical protein
MFLRLARYVPANGILFAALVIIAELLQDEPGEKASDAEVLTYYADSGNRDAEFVAVLLIGLSGFCFLSFLGTLRGALARAEGEPARLTTAAVAAGVAFIALALAAHAVGTAMAGAAGFFDTFEVDPNTARVLISLSFGLFVLSLFAAAAMTAAVAVIALLLGGVPRWLGWFGLLATVAGLLGFLVLPSLVVLAWIVAASVWLLVPAAQPPVREADRWRGPRGNREVPPAPT